MEGYGLLIDYRYDEDESTEELERSTNYYSAPDLVAAEEYECSVVNSTQVAVLYILDIANVMPPMGRFQPSPMRRIKWVHLALDLP